MGSANLCDPFLCVNMYIYTVLRQVDHGSNQLFDSDQ